MMWKNISNVGWCYLTYGLLTCGYFCSAAIGGWRYPDLLSAFDSPGYSSYSSGSSGYSGGSSYGRSSGGFWGGGK